MTTEEKSIEITEFACKTEDWGGLFKKFLAIGRWKDYSMLLIGADQNKRCNKGPPKEEYYRAVRSITANSKIKRDFLSQVMKYLIKAF